MRRALRRFYRSLLYRRAAGLDERQLLAPAMVFAPHPDDEVLGCGGTILRKKQAGAQVRIVFLTDGSASHPGRISPEDLRKQRRQEAEAAARRLGLGAEDLHFLAFEDGRLSWHQIEAVAAVADLISSCRPAQIFIPCSQERPSDHRAGRSVVRQALRSAGHTAQVFEAPIWFWDHWPWTSTTGSSPAATFKKSWKRDMRYLLPQFRTRVSVQGILPQKRAALAEHRSQMEPDGQDPAWMTLEKVAGGEWLDCFFQPYEVFAAYSYPRPA